MNMSCVASYVTWHETRAERLAPMCYIITLWVVIGLTCPGPKYIARQSTLLGTTRGTLTPTPTLVWFVTVQRPFVISPRVSSIN